MKTTMGQIRRALHEARYRPKKPGNPPGWDQMSDKDKAFSRGNQHYEKLDAHDGIKAGDWVMVKSHGAKPSAAEVTGFTMVHAKDREPYLTISTNHGGHTSQRRYDVWKDEDFLGPADEEDIANAKDRWASEEAWMAKNIDTSRQGT
jgi:hypothetical protein